MSSILYVALGGALGASGRYLLGQGASRVFGAGFPIGTLSANIIGSALMGVLFGYLSSRGSDSDTMRLFLGVGLLGGFTTFSAFSLESIMMLEQKNYGGFVSYIGLSVGLSLLALIAGLWLSRGGFTA